MHPKPFENSLIISIFVKYNDLCQSAVHTYELFDFATQDKRHLANYRFGKNDKIR